ncbi:MAG TPA: TnsA endonuclease N-terminal domain-containing protein [Ktedonobacteraceae bacterium]|nr:TnsA endonuclease N-terminal domain-containing protein [Ktedonobacteraceae bacterium]
MALKRKPPAGNIRRVAPIGNNLRYAITSKANETVQCESFQERKLTLLFDRDPTVQEYRSQPERFAFTDSQGNSHTYVPDFIVWKTTGEIEIHEVTLTSRQDRFGIQEREKAARSICQQRGWRYVVHTEATLPQATEEANLLALYRYRPSIYANAAVTAALHRRLKGNERQAVHFLITELAHALSLPEPTVISALCHLLWYRVIETDLTSRLLFVNAALTSSVQVWLVEEERHA